MKKIRKTLLLFFLFSKRLLKRISFWLLLCAAPLSAAGMRKLSAQESGMLHILLCQEKPSDSLSEEIVDRLLTEKSVIQYTLIEREQEAYALVQSGEADAAWIFPGELQEKLDQFTAGERWEGLIRIVEREDNVALQLSREKLFGVLYSHASYSLYQNFIRKDLEMEADEDTLLRNYENAAVEGSLFRFAFVNGDRGESDAAQQNFLITPVRGMLSLLVLLGALTGTMYFLQDQEKGVLDMIPHQRRRGFLYLHQFTVTGYMAAAMLTALYASGVFTRGYTELAWIVVYVIMCAGFGSLLQRICGSLRRLAAVIPILMLLSFVLCPVFFSLRQLKALPYLLPPFYYLNAIHNEAYFGRMICYCIIVYGIDLVWGRMSD